ncbi:hypothetical protein GCM10010211_67010 [Streptomyces albospinus]|uniref:LigA protein n=1 Tax=Streptomyces albospinus TaxID=285515 RepID=A0ABQ2VJ98_9ACTN|nr:hypothetical protein [Streptomyces albospinus]GGU90976.1 hypothetical protein GCM10010211_67010 [Streptomyces albospinus]
MTNRTAPAFAPAPGTVRAVLRATAIAACVPYLSLKIAWLAGSHLGIPAGSPLRRDGGPLMAFNALTVLMDAAVIVLAFLLTRPWGRRVPAWLFVLPMWCATGLLAPIVAVCPAQLLAGVLHARPASRGGDPGALLAPWVWTVVYTGFIVQALALGALFVPYARERWGHLWRGPLGALPESATGPARRLTAGLAAVLTVIPAGMHLLWAAGGTAGLSPARVAARDLDARLNDAGYVLFAVLLAAGVLLLAYSRGGRVPLRVPLVAAWIGSGALACWGGWMTLTALPVPAGDPKLPDPLMSLTYAVQMIVGMLVAVAGAHFFAERDAQRRAEGEPEHAADGAASGPAGIRPGAVRCG